MIRAHNAIASAGLFVLFMAPSAQADTVIRERVEFAWKRGLEGPVVEEQQYWLAGTRARLDQEAEAFYIDTEAGEFYALDRKVRQYYFYPSPLTLEATTPPALVEQVREKRAQLMPRTIDVTRSGETMRIAGYDAEHVRIEAGGPDEPLTAKFDLWLSAALWQELSDTAYWPLERDRLSTSPFTSWLVEVFRDLKGYPVRFGVLMELQGGRMRTEYVRMLVAVDHEREIPPATYELPSDVTPFPRPASGFVSPRRQ